VPGRIGRPLSLTRIQVIGMSEQSEVHSELVELAKRSGDFQKHYGKVIGAYLYLRSVSAARGRSMI
jgi:hypothetical protein